MKLFVFMILLISVVVDIFEVNKFVLVTEDDIILFEVILFDIILFDVILVDISFTVRILEAVIFVTVEFEKVAEPKLDEPLMVTFPTVISPCIYVLFEITKLFPIKTLPAIEAPPNVVKLPPDPRPVEFVVLKI